MEPVVELITLRARRKYFVNDQLPATIAVNTTRRERGSYLGNLGVVSVWIGRDNLPPLQLRPDHEGVHRPLDVVWRMFFGLKQEKK